MTIPMFKKLLAMRNVADNFFGFAKSFDIRLKRFDFCSKPLSTSACVNENSATSDAEINAEQISRTINTIQPKVKNELSMG